jgi:hypothetical protein
LCLQQKYCASTFATVHMHLLVQCVDSNYIIIIIIIQYRYCVAVEHVT